MAKRLVIDAGGSSPFRVSAGGFDADNSYVDQLLFDGNSAAVRIHKRGRCATVQGASTVTITPQSDGSVSFNGYVYDVLDKTFPAPPLALFMSQMAGTSIFKWNGVNNWELSSLESGESAPASQRGGHAWKEQTNFPTTYTGGPLCWTSVDRVASWSDQTYYCVLENQVTS